jgi:hypothetical protein
MVQIGMCFEGRELVNWLKRRGYHPTAGSSFKIEGSGRPHETVAEFLAGEQRGC